MGQDVYIAPPPVSNTRNWSCCLWGCLVAFIFTVLIAIVLFLVGRSSLRTLSENYTTPTPVTLPTVEVEPAVLDELLTRFDTFRTNVKEKQPAEPLILTQDEINALIQHHPDWQYLRDKVYVLIEGGLVKGEVNFPLPPIPFLSGRYFHGTATFDIKLQDGRLELYVDSATVNGKPVPDDYMAGFKNQNLAQDAMRDDADLRAVVDQLESIRIEDNRLIVEPKQTGGAEAPGTAPAVVEEMPPDTAEEMPPAEAPAPETTDNDPAIVEQPEPTAAP